MGAGIEWVEAREAANHSTMHSTVPHHKGLVQMVIIEVEKLV